MRRSRQANLKLATQALTLSKQLEELLHDGAVLRFYFPGSPLWEVQRKLRRSEQLSRSRNFLKAFTTTPMLTV
eukprot:SAG22_NODE_10348_length_540_cov_0.696145_1_plen_72_part_10